MSMGRSLRFVAVLGMAAVLLLSSSGARPGSAAGVASSNVEYVTTLPYETGAPSSARLLGKRLYVAGAKSLSIYDVSDPIAPELLSITPTGFAFPSEDIDTNGKVLLMMDETGRQGLQVWDVEDPSAPTKLATVSGLRDHTFSCVLGCRWGYGSRGTIVDLRKPAAPRVAGNWGVPIRGDGYDVTEVAPGIVLTATRTMLLLDARKNPVSPKVIASGSTADDRLLHSNKWPSGGRDDFILVQGETPFTGVCTEDSGAFMTWDATRYRKTRTFEMIDEFRVQNGTFVDGNPPAGGAGCTNMWFEAHPDFKDGGLVASAFFEHGTRFLEVDSAGQIEEVGYFTPIGGETISTVWITDEIVYAIDLTRGIDILRFDAG